MANNFSFLTIVPRNNVSLSCLVLPFPSTVHINVTAKQFSFKSTSLLYFNSDWINDFPCIFCSFSQPIKKNVFMYLIAIRYMDLKQDEVTGGALENCIVRSFIVCSPCQILTVYYAWWLFKSNESIWAWLIRQNCSQRKSRRPKTLTKIRHC
jgi:hypothetical protein